MFQQNEFISFETIIIACSCLHSHPHAAAQSELVIENKKLKQKLSLVKVSKLLDGHPILSMLVFTG